MRIIGDKVGRFEVDVELANFEDIAEAKRGHLDPEKVRRLKVRGLVDPGASRLVLPASVAKKLGLTITGKVRVRYADQRTAKRDRVEGVHLELLGRNSIFSATVEPKRDTALIGAIVFEELDLLVDCGKERLMRRDPHFIVSEIE